MKVRANLKRIENLTYQYSEDQVDLVTDLNRETEELFNRFQSYLPKKDGLVMRPRGNQSVVIMKRKIRKAKLSLVCSSLPTPAKRQKPSTQRVGSIADRKRKLQV